MHIFFRGAHVLLASLFILQLAEITAVQSVNAQNRLIDMNLTFEPKIYTAFRARQPIKIDGDLDKEEWNHVPWTDYFGAIAGGPRYFEDKPSRVKLLWDDEYLYIAAELTEPDLWATMTERNSPLYNDNAFEIFIDPDGDTHNYFEFECNALGTIWDIYLNKPYRDGGIILSDWNLLTEDETAVKTYGTLNDPGDRDEKWTVEVAIPIDQMVALHTGKNSLEPGDYWKMNFVRTHRQLVKKNRQYHIAKDSITGEKIPPVYDTWTSQGLINMHYPEMWGVVFFSEELPGQDTSHRKIQVPVTEYIKWHLRRIYYAMHAYQEQKGHFTDKINNLDLDVDAEDIAAPVPVPQHINITDTKIQTTQTQFEATVKTQGGKAWHINQEGRMWH